MPRSPFALLATVRTLLAEGRVALELTPWRREQLNAEFPRIRALLAEAGYAGQLCFAGHLAQAYALYDPRRHSELDVLRWLHERTCSGPLAATASRHSSAACPRPEL